MSDTDPADPSEDDSPLDDVTDDGRAHDGSDGDVRDEDVRDELPADLDTTGLVGPYLFPNNSRRRIPAVLYAVMGAGCLALFFFLEDSAMVNGGFLTAGVVLVAVAAYHWQAGWNLDVDEQDALQAATREVGFPIGHASAQLGWRGLRSRPTWRILLYSNEPSPESRGLVLVDGIDGEIIDTFVERNPEDWSAYQ